MTSESNIAALGLALKVVKRPKRSAVLDAGMRITGEKTTFGQEVEREQKHTTGQKRKQPGKRSPVQVQRKKDLSLLMRCSYVAAYQERCELLLILLPLTSHRWLEKRGDELQRLPSSHVCCILQPHPQHFFIMSCALIRLDTTFSEICTGAKKL